MAGAPGESDRALAWACTLDEEVETFRRLRHATLMSMLAGVAAVTLSLWSVASLPLLLTWLKAGLLLGATCWLMARSAGASAGLQAPSRRVLIVVLSLLPGCFWGFSAWLLLPAGSPEHQLLLAFAVTIVIAAWVPVFVLAPVTAVSLGAVASVPWSMLLLSADDPLAMGAGLALLLLVGVLMLAARVLRRLLHAKSDQWQELQHHATHDALVDLPNHAEFHRHLDALDCRRDFAILVIDLDDFKQVNDSAGHAAGDEALCLVADVLRGFVRDGDKAGRLGGDEFAIVLAGSGAQEAARVAAAIQTGIRRLRRVGAAWHCQISASIGIGCSGAAGLVRATQVLKAADDACYRAKRRGRNRIEMAPAVELCRSKPLAMRPRPGAAGGLRLTGSRSRLRSAAAVQPVTSANDASFMSKGTS